MKIAFLILGGVFAVIALVFAGQHDYPQYVQPHVPSVRAAGGVCGFAIAAGLCFIAAAIVDAFGCRDHQIKTPNKTDAGDGK